MDEMFFIIQIPLSPWPKIQPALSPISRIPPTQHALFQHANVHNTKMLSFLVPLYEAGNGMTGPRHGYLAWLSYLTLAGLLFAVALWMYSCVQGKCGCTNNDTDKWLSQRLQNLVCVIMLHNNIIVIIGMTQYISIEFFNTCYLDQHKIAGYRIMCRCGRFCYKKMMWVRFFKMYISNIYVHIYACVCMHVCLIIKKSKGLNQNTLQIVVVSIINLIDCVHQIVNKILIFLQNVGINSNATAKMDSSYLKTWKKWYHTWFYSYI